MAAKRSGEGLHTRQARRHPALYARDPFVRRTGGDHPRAHVEAEPWVPRIKRGMTVFRIGKVSEMPTSPGRAKPYISWRLQRAGRDGLVKDGAPRRRAAAALRAVLEQPGPPSDRLAVRCDQTSVIDFAISISLFETIPSVIVSWNF